MSDESIAALTLRGGLPGLLRRGSPVVPRDAISPDHTGLVIEAIASTPPGVYAVFQWNPDEDPENISRLHWMARDVALDLRDATGRAHAAWWLLAKCYAGGWPDLHTGARLWLDPVLYVDNPVGHDWNRVELWRILRKAGRIYDWLEGLDPDDPRLLEDGSRHVDAMALKLVCEHVAGAK